MVAVPSETLFNILKRDLSRQDALTSSPQVQEMNRLQTSPYITVFSTLSLPSAERPLHRLNTSSCTLKEPSTNHNTINLSSLVLHTDSSTSCRVLLSHLSRNSRDSISQYVCLRPSGPVGGSVPSHTPSSSSCTMKPEDISSDATQAVRYFTTFLPLFSVC